MTHRQEVSDWMCMLAGALCVIALCAVATMESCAENGPQMRECEARGGTVIRGQHGGWRCDPERR